MKISSSSSFIFATLALSSSSSTLAAPAGEAPESGMTSSPSNHHIASRSGPTAEVQSAGHDEAADMGDQRATTEGLLEILCPLVGGLPLFSGICSPPSARAVMRRDEPVTDTSPSSSSPDTAPSGTTDTLYPSAAPSTAANTPNNTPNIAAAGVPFNPPVIPIVGGVAGALPVPGPNLPVPNLPIPNLPIPNLPVPNLPIPNPSLPVTPSTLTVAPPDAPVSPPGSLPASPPGSLPLPLPGLPIAPPIAPPGALPGGAAGPK